MSADVLLAHGFKYEQDHLWILPDMTTFMISDAL